MGKIIGGFIGTVVTVFLTLFVQNWYAKNLTQTRFDLNYTSFEASISLTPEQKKIITADQSDTLAFTIYDIENGGSEPLTDQRVRVDTEGFGGTKILAAGSTSFPGDDKESVGVQVNGRSAIVDYKILNPGEKHRLWIVDTGYGLSTLIARKPGLRVSNVDRSFNDNSSIFDDPFLLGFISLVVAFFIFGFGALMGWNGFADEIKKRGFSPEEILKLEPEHSIPPKAQ